MPMALTIEMPSQLVLDKALPVLFNFIAAIFPIEEK
jgi:hypothetical protein